MTGHLELSGRTVLVTGAGAGLGRAYACDLAARGATVVANDVNGQALADVQAATAGCAGRVVAAVGSVADWGIAAALIDQAHSCSGHLDAVINNAGIFATSAAIDETEEHVRQTIEVNLIGSMFVGIHALRKFAAAGDGLLLNTTSRAYLGLADTGAYAAAKGGVVSMSYCWARELRGTGVRVNVLAPRARTQMSYVRSTAGSLGAEPPERVAPVIAALMSDAGREISGVVLAFDGRNLAVLDRPRARELGPAGGEWTDERLRAALSGVRG
jgi:NAD(P)-dependent dehydrogenase (short-subunit alcohol dehydrogenase family)